MKFFFTFMMIESPEIPAAVRIRHQRKIVFGTVHRMAVGMKTDIA